MGLVLKTMGCGASSLRSIPRAEGRGSFPRSRSLSSGCSARSSDGTSLPNPMDLASCGSSDAGDGAPLPSDGNVSWSQLEPHQKEQFFSDGESNSEGKVSFEISGSDMSDVDSLSPSEVHLVRTMRIDETVRETRNSNVVAVVTTPSVMTASSRSSV